MDEYVRRMYRKEEEFLEEFLRTVEAAMVDSSPFDTTMLAPPESASHGKLATHLSFCPVRRKRQCQSALTLPLFLKNLKKTLAATRFAW
jgi:hypothetical protein